MNRQRGPLSHVQIDDGDESDWDTVTEIKEKTGSIQQQHTANNGEIQETPRDDTSYYQPSSVDIPVITDNVPKNDPAPEVVNSRRTSISSSVSSKENFSQSSEKAPTSVADQLSKRSDRTANTRVAGKYAAATGRSDSKPPGQTNNLSAREATPRSVTLIDETKSKAVVITEFSDKMHEIADHSDSGVDETGAETMTRKDHIKQQQQQQQQQQRKWTSIMMPASDINKKARAKFAAAINQPIDEHFQGENYFDLFRQSRYEYQFAQAPSGAEERFLLPRENPKPKTMRFVDRVEIIAQRSLAELFAVIRVIFAVVIAVLVQTATTVIGGLIQPVIVASITIFGAYFLQPILVALFNYIISPLLSFFHNICAASFRCLQPFFNLLGQFFFNVAELVRSFRLVDVHLMSRQISNEDSTTKKDNTLTVGTLQPV